MKSAISNIWLLGLVVLFIFIFAGYLAITINYTKTFKVKNEMITMIEKQKGVVDKATGAEKNSIIKSGKVYSDVGSLQTISLYLYGMGYKVKGTCDTASSVNAGEGWYGVTKLGIPGSGTTISPEYEKVSAGKKYYYCFAHGRYKKHKEDGASVDYSHYYKVQVFYKMDLPVLGDLFTFRVEGITAEIFNPTCGNNTVCKIG